MVLNPLLLKPALLFSVGRSLERPPKSELVGSEVSILLQPEDLTLRV